MRIAIGLALLIVGVVLYNATDNFAATIWIGGLGLLILPHREQPERRQTPTVRIRGSVRIRRHWWSP